MHITSMEVRELLSKFILRECRKHSRKPNRKDNVRVGIMRCLLKVPLELLKIMGTKNKYRKSNTQEFVFAYCEAFAAFATTFQVTCELDTMLQSFLEFTIMSFPVKTKVSVIFEGLSKESHQKVDLPKLMDYAQKRDNKSLEHIMQWVIDSPVLRKVFCFAEDVLETNASNLVATRLVSEILNRTE